MATSESDAARAVAVFWPLPLALLWLCTDAVTAVLLVVYAFQVALQITIHGVIQFGYVSVSL